MFPVSLWGYNFLDRARHTRTKGVFNARRLATSTDADLKYPAKI